MVIGRGGILLFGEKLLEGCFLLGRAGQDEGELVERQIRGY
jgi:hypothetical protein